MDTRARRPAIGSIGKYEIAFKCTRALPFAHGLGISHRHFKPANILYSGGSQAKVSDFGAAFLANADQTQVARIGTPVFMSSEQVQDQTVDHRSDIYALAGRSSRATPTPSRGRCWASRAG
jgi:serine/threonine protein kinase